MLEEPSRKDLTTYEQSLELVEKVNGIPRQDGAVSKGGSSVAGIMLESHLNPGAQKLVSGLEGLEYGVSITDACIDWATTEELLLEAHGALSGKVGATA